MDNAAKSGVWTQSLISGLDRKLYIWQIKTLSQSFNLSGKATEILKLFLKLVNIFCNNVDKPLVWIMVLLLKVLEL